MAKKAQIHASVEVELKDKIEAIAEYDSQLSGHNISFSQIVDKLLKTGMEAEGFVFGLLDNGKLVADKL
jgi:hypothetical protein